MLPYYNYLYTREPEYVTKILHNIYNIIPGWETVQSSNEKEIQDLLKGRSTLGLYGTY